MTAARARRQVCNPVLWPGQEPFTLYTEGDDLYAAMLHAIAGAKHEVALESFIFADDEVGRGFAEALAGRARAGVRVRMQLDAAGSLFWASRQLIRYLQENGVGLRWFHRWHWTRPWRYNQRNHRKLLVVDRERAFLGGFNIHRESSRRHYGKQRWRDTHVGVTGPLARQAHEAFRALWQERAWSPGPEAEPPSAVVLPNKSPDCQHRLRCIFAAMFGSARRRIDLTTPYFVPDEITQQALIAAAQRDVEVRVLVPDKGDIAPVRWVARRIYSRLLRHGVRVFGYRPRLLHAKTVTVDGEWATVGTANLDYRSLFLNHELNLCARDAGLATDLETQFEADLGDATELDPTGAPQTAITERLLVPLAWGARRWL